MAKICISDGLITSTDEFSFCAGSNRFRMRNSVHSNSPTEIPHLSASSLVVAGDLTVHGSCTLLNTTVCTTSAMSITNAGTGPALVVNQTGSQPVVNLQDDGTSVLYIEDGGNVGIGTTNPVTLMHLYNNIDADDAYGYFQIENGNTTSGSAATNVALTTKNYHGTSQFMQWEEHGLRLGSRITTNSGAGNLYFTTGSDSVGMCLLGSTLCLGGSVIAGSCLAVGAGNSGYLRDITGSFGSIEVDGGATGGWEGYSIGGRAVFMHDNVASTGIYNDVHNHWILYGSHNGDTRLYYAGTAKLCTTSGGAQIVGNLNLNASNPSLTWANNYLYLNSTTASIGVLKLCKNSSGTAYSPRFEISDSSDATRVQLDSCGTSFVCGTFCTDTLRSSGSAIFGPNSIDPDSFGSCAGGFGDIADGSGWGARGLFVHGGGTGDAAAIAHNGSCLYFGIQNGCAANSMATWMSVAPNCGKTIWGTTTICGTTNICSCLCSGDVYICSSTNSWNGGLQMLSQDGSDLYCIHPDNNGCMYVNKSWYFNDGDISFGKSNPYICSSSYVVMPGGLYVSGGTAYFQNHSKHRNGLGNDSGAWLCITGGTAGDTSFGGNVGIGTTDPAYMLQVHCSSDIWHASFGGNGGNQLRIGGATGSGAVIGAYGNNTNSCNRDLYLQRDGGNVGIGTSSPSAKLDVCGTGTVFSVNGTNGTLFSVEDDLSDSLMSVNDAAGLPVLEVFADSSVCAGRYSCSDFYIASGGNIGIGTTDPYSRFQVGDTEQTTQSELTIASRYDGGGPILNFRVGHPSNAYTWNAARICATDHGNYNGRLDFQTTVNNGYNGTQPTTRLRINASGDICATCDFCAYQYCGHSNIDGTGFAARFPCGIYSSGTSWMYGTTWKNNSSIMDLNEVDFVDDVKFCGTGSANELVLCGANAFNIELILQTAGTTRGYLHANNGNNVGLLDAGGHWAIKHCNDNNTAFYDSNETLRASIGTVHSQFCTGLAVCFDWGYGNHNEQLTVRGTYPSIALRNTLCSGSVWLLHHESTTGELQFWGAPIGCGANSTGWTQRMNLSQGGCLWVNCLGVGNGGSGYLRDITGDYGSIEVAGGATGGWSGYSIDGRAVFMHNGAGATGIYNDANNEWLFYGTHNAETRMYHNGTARIFTTGTGACISQSASGDYGLEVNGAPDGKIVLSGSTNPYIRFQEGTTNKGYIQWNGSEGALIISNEEDNRRIYLNTDLCFYNGTACCQVWHEGNICPAKTHRPYLTNTTTACVMAQIQACGLFTDTYASAFKTPWDYAGNADLTDAGRLTELAGTSWLTWTDNCTSATRGNITALVIAPNTGGSANKAFIYVDQGATYAPGWREIWTSTSDGSGSGLDADLLDGQHGSYYLDYNNFTNTPAAGSSLCGYTCSANTAVGCSSHPNNCGMFNTSVGLNSLYSNSAGWCNSVVGSHALCSNTSGFCNTVMGMSAMRCSTTGTGNTSIGQQAALSNTTGGDNVAIGKDASFYNTTGNWNTAIGANALHCNTVSQNTAVGYQALYSNTTGGCNSALGYQALRSYTTGPWSTAIGACAAYASTGSEITAIGGRALEKNTTGFYHAAGGNYALFCNTTGAMSTAFGHSALYTNTTGSYNTAFGQSALRFSTTASQNTALGGSALYNTTTGGDNVAVGAGAGLNNSSGCRNIFVGISSGSSVTTAIQTIAVGRAASPSNTDYHTVWGNSSNNVCNCVYTAWSNVSDCRDKTDIAPLNSCYGVSFIKKLSPVSYKWDNRETYVREYQCTYGEKDGSLKSEKCHYGFIAQDIKSSIEELNITFDALGHDDSKDAYRLTYEELIAPLVKAVQELVGRVETIEQAIGI